MHKILFITDDWDRKKSLKSGMLEYGCTITPLPSSKLFDEEFLAPKSDIVIADFERAIVERAKLIHAIQRDPVLKSMPLVLLLTEEDLDRLDLGWGVEDYLTLPVSPKRLAQRLNFLLWKLNRVELKNGFAKGGLVINFERYEVHVNGQLVDLTYKEFELLKFLAMTPGRVFTREALLDKVWGYDYYGGTRTVDVHIRRLRSKIEVGGAIHIETVRNVGYKFLEHLS